MHFFSLVVGSSLACTNCPYRFVSKDDLAEVVSRKVEERTFNLSLYYIEVSTVFAFCQYFADAEDWGKTVFKSQKSLFLKSLSCFAIILTTL